MDQIDDAMIDTGVFKYVQITLTEKEDPTKTKTIVRGLNGCGFHSDVFAKFQENELAVLGLEDKFILNVPGGGRIEHKSDEKKIHIYGYSVSYGLANHELTQWILEKSYPDYTITWSNDGY